ncbi:MAG: family 43 glycosylhydrolase [Dehalococcoidia bacterium]|nr:family 43 glycosylhydrolase [Dehalococcoidia bacterium]
MKIKDVLAVKWSDYSETYIIDHPALSPVLADPTFIFPENSPDRKWHLFAHSIWGIHHFISWDGIRWKDIGIAIKNAMRPYVYIEDNQYYLLYEKYRPWSLALSWVKGRKWYSEIAVSQSVDLKKWTSPVTLIKPELHWHSADGNKSVSNPCMVKHDGKYYLYYSASLVYIPDCGFNEPDCIGLATSSSICGNYELLPQPIINVNKNDPRCNLSCGSIKVIKCEDGFLGFENGIYWNEQKNQSGSAIIMQKSVDGIYWESLGHEPVLRPSTGWRKSHIYACDARYYEQKGTWYLYYNARSDWPVSKGQERIGLLIGR